MDGPHAHVVPGSRSSAAAAATTAADADASDPTMDSAEESKHCSDLPLPLVPDYDCASASSEEEDDYDDPYYPNRALQVLRTATPPTSPKGPSSSSAPKLNSSSPNSSPPRSLSPPRRPRLLQHSSALSPPPCTASASAHSSASSSAPPAITPLLPAHGAPTFVPPPASLTAAGPSGEPSTPPRATSPPLPEVSVQDIQARIREISRNPNLPEAEKDRQRQAMFSQPFQQHRKKEAMAFAAEMHRQRYTVTYSDVEHPQTGEKMPGCEHYPRNCKLKADCCGLWIVCRLCHDHPNTNHSMDRFKTKEVMCMLCKTVQPVARHCANAACGVEFAKYFCNICKFYDNTPGKNIYHCHKCKICRVGKGIGHDNIHCDRCDACVSREYSKHHRCLKRSLDANCPICGHYLFTSTKPVVFMRCGHTMHSHCFDVYTAEQYICPLCHKALTNMRPYYAQIDEAVRRESMPPELRNKLSEVLCHDCDKRSETPYHFLYLKCQTSGCGSYNTRLLRTYEKGSAAAAEVAVSMTASASGEGDHDEDSDNGDDSDDSMSDDSDDDSMSDDNDDGQGIAGSSVDEG